MSLMNHILPLLRSSRVTCLALGGLAMLASGCPKGDSTTGVGDYGRLQYALHSDYFMTSNEIRDVRIVTGHRQYISVQWIDVEEESTDEEEVWENRLVGSGYEALESPYMDAEVRADGPGTFPLESWRDGALVDQISLTFAEPDHIDLLTFVRQPGESSFLQVATGETARVMEGTQVAFVVVPIAEDGERLAGRMDTEHDFSPSWAAVAGENVFGVYEDGVLQGVNSLSYYLIEPGTVTVDFQDITYGIGGSHRFDVVSANPAEQDER